MAGFYIPGRAVHSGRNWYGYCNGNPVRYGDSTGCIRDDIAFGNTGKKKAAKKPAATLSRNERPGGVPKATTTLTKHNSSRGAQGTGGGVGTSINGVTGNNLDAYYRGQATSPSTRYNDAELPDMADYGVPDMQWPGSVSEYKQLSGDHKPTSVAVSLYSFALVGGGIPYNFTGNNTLDQAFSQSAIVNALIDETVDDFRQRGEMSGEYAYAGNRDLYRSASLTDKDLMMGLGTIDMCYVVCERQLSGEITVTVEVMDSYKFLFLESNETPVVNSINNLLGYLPQQAGILKPYTLYYSYSTMR